MSDNRYTTTAYYYDAQGRVIQSRSTSIVSGYNITYAAYNFDGTVQQTLSEQGSTEDPMREQYTYSYDHVGRPAQVLYAHSNEPEIRLSENIYDAHGQLSARFRHNHADTTFYARDVRGALTASVNSRFSERLFYGDSLPQGATACYNGNIAAATVTNGDSTLIFGYTYDAYNRLTESLHLQGNQARSSEFFQFDNMGNITRLQRHTLDNRLIDDLQFTYSGNQVTAITDYAGCLDRYDTKEYTDRNTTTNTIEQRYDANGNLITDLDRGIQRIRYNILNLPDTVFFTNGNRLINSYDATGRKWQSQTVTSHESELFPIDDGTLFDENLLDISLTQYNGSMEYRYTLSIAHPDSLVLVSHIVHNTEGYREYTGGIPIIIPAKKAAPIYPMLTCTQYYYHQDHLGNNCAVWDATNNKVAQRTWYYASGTPMPVSTAQGAQPYKYNGKEYVESHGYDTYDYGFRGYYATIGRFTSIDPLTERTPWQSPYTYANNNWVNLIDWKGLSGFSSMHTSNAYPQSYNYIVIDRNGYFLGGVDDDDNHIYMSEDSEWDEQKGKKGLKEVGEMIFSFSTYMDMALSSGFNFRVPGYYYGQNSIGLSIRTGLAIQKSIPTPIKKRPLNEIKIALNLMSFDVFRTNIILGESADINFFGRKGKATISNGISVALWGIEQTFDIRLKDCAYICGTNNVTISPIEKNGETGYTISFSGGIFITYSFTLHFDLFYEQK